MAIARDQGADRSLAHSPEDLQPLHQLCREGRLYDVERWIADGKSLQLAPEAIGIGRVRDLRLPPKASIPSRRGPAPKPAPWIAGLIIEQLVAKSRDEGAQSTPRTQDLLVDLISSLCGRTIEKQEYMARRRSFDDQELGRVAERLGPRTNCS